MVQYIGKLRKQHAQTSLVWMKNKKCYNRRVETQGKIRGRTENMWTKVWLTPIENNMRGSCMRWFGHAQLRSMYCCERVICFKFQKQKWFKGRPK